MRRTREWRELVPPPVVVAAFAAAAQDFPLHSELVSPDPLAFEHSPPAGAPTHAVLLSQPPLSAVLHQQQAASRAADDEWIPTPGHERQFRVARHRCAVAGIAPTENNQVSPYTPHTQFLLFSATNQTGGSAIHPQQEKSTEDLLLRGLDGTQ